MLLQRERARRARLELDRAAVAPATHATDEAFLLHAVDEAGHRAHGDPEAPAECLRDHRALLDERPQERQLALGHLEAGREQLLRLLETVGEQLDEAAELVDAVLHWLDCRMARASCHIPRLSVKPRRGRWRRALTLPAREA
jgi:hypothetical protein